jgi:DNA-binding NarL/FixJ family response regulator
VSELEVIARSSSVRERVPVYVSACDPLSHDGLANQLRGQQVELVDKGRAGDDDVVGVVVVDAIDQLAAHEMRTLRRRGVGRLVVVAGRVDDSGLLIAAEVGATCVIRRHEVTTRTLMAAIRAAAAGEGSLPPDLLGRLLGQVGRLQQQVLTPQGITFSGLTDRELEILRLLAEGYDTVAVGQRLFISDRTVKNVLHALTSRLNLRNRTHAVAYALRQGFI